MRNSFMAAWLHLHLGKVADESEDATALEVKPNPIFLKVSETFFWRLP